LKGLAENTTHHKHKDMGLNGVRVKSMSLHLPSTFVGSILGLYNEFNYIYFSQHNNK